MTGRLMSSPRAFVPWLERVAARTARGMVRPSAAEAALEVPHHIDAVRALDSDAHGPSFRPRSGQVIVL